MNVLVKMLDPLKIQDLSQAFHDIDKDQTGMITILELQEALIANGQQLTTE
jgi:Ca2+-binding EF-hand superfamily protein